MLYVHLISENSVTVINTANGDQVKFLNTDFRYIKAIELIKLKQYSDVFNLDIKHIVKSFIKYNSEITISIEDNIGYITLHLYNNMKVKLDDAITKRIIKMEEQGFDSTPLVNFLTKLYANPSRTATDELYLFIDNCELPITDDGDFIAYKIVQSDYMDIYSGTMRNMIGDVVSMPRTLVDDNRNKTCSTGLHFCSKNYLNNYGSVSRDTDKCMLVKINPADVVSIPSDYNNAKGRAWRYIVVGEVASGWRNTLQYADYTDQAVVYTTTEQIIQTEDEKELTFKDGYLDGWRAHRYGEYDNCIRDLNNGEYCDGWNQAVKDRRNKKAKKF